MSPSLAFIFRDRAHICGRGRHFLQPSAFNPVETLMLAVDERSGTARLFCTTERNARIQPKLLRSALVSFCAMYRGSVAGVGECC